MNPEELFVQLKESTSSAAKSERIHESTRRLRRQDGDRQLGPCGPFCFCPLRRLPASVTIRTYLTVNRFGRDASPRVTRRSASRPEHESDKRLSDLPEWGRNLTPKRLRALFRSSPGGSGTFFFSSAKNTILQARKRLTFGLNRNACLVSVLQCWPRSHRDHRAPSSPCNV